MHAFPSAAARHLFHHYISSTSRIVIALGNDDMSQNPILAVALPMVLLDTNSPACAALRLSLLSTAAAHLDHLQPGGQLVKTNDMNVLAQKMKKQAMGHLVMSLTRNGDDELDVILAVCVITLIRDVSGRRPSTKADPSGPKRRSLLEREPRIRHQSHPEARWTCSFTS